MAKYYCPVENCNVSFDNPLGELIPMAIGHARGSHGLQYTEQQVRDIIHNVDVQAREVDKPVDLKKWWARINKKDA